MFFQTSWRGGGGGGGGDGYSSTVIVLVNDYTHALVFCVHVGTYVHVYRHKESAFVRANAAVGPLVGARVIFNAIKHAVVCV